jgi:hypothetical protein
MRAGFTGDEQSGIVGPIFALSLSLSTLLCPACDISIGEQLDKEKKRKKKKKKKKKAEEE